MNMIRFCIGRPRLRPINQTSEPRHNTPRHIARRMRQNKPHHLSEPLTAKANIPPRRKHTHLTSSVIFPEAVVWYPTWESENKRPTEQLHALPAPPPAPGKRTKHSPLTTAHHPALQNCSSDSPPSWNSIVAFTNSWNQQQKRK